MIIGLFAVSITPAYAQHHSGSAAPPIDFDGLKVALSAILSPEDFTYGDSKSANLSIRFFDSETNTNIKSVTYRVQIFHEDDLVANEYFYDEDGKLDLEIKPVTGCQNDKLWKCTKYYGEKHAIAGAYYARGDSLPVIQGPIFDQSGKYNIQVSIVGAINPKTMTTKDLLFETFLHIPEKQVFQIKTASAQEFSPSIKSYNDEISNFNFDASINKISYEIPFNWNDHDHDSDVNQIIFLPKDFPTFTKGYDIAVFIEGKKIQNSFYDFDFSEPDQNIIRINIPHEELVLLTNKLDNQIKKNTLKIELLSGEQTNLIELDLKFENNFSVTASWDSAFNVGKKIPFTFSFFDRDSKPAKNILFAYSISDSTGKEIWSNIGASDEYLGILAPHGIYRESILIPTNEKYQLKIILIGQNFKNFENLFTSTTDFRIISQSMTAETMSSVPAWIKNNAGWWADGIIGDKEFVQSIQFLINQKIISISVTEYKSTDSQDIPAWIKNNAGWWADGLISERDFVKGIEFLVSQGIIR